MCVLDGEGSRVFASSSRSIYRQLCIREASIDNCVSDCDCLTGFCDDCVSDCDCLAGFCEPLLPPCRYHTSLINV